MACDENSAAVPESGIQSWRFPSVGPHFPRCLSGFPKLLKLILLAQRIHRLPKSVMPVSTKLTRAGKRLHGFLLPNSRVARYKGEHFGRQHKKTAVDPRPVAGRFFLKTTNAVTACSQSSKSARCSCGGYSRQPAVRTMKID